MSLGSEKASPSLGYASSGSRGAWPWIALAVAVLLVGGMLLAGTAWYIRRVSNVPIGLDWRSGKAISSPDGRFKAEGLVWSGSGRSWCTMEVTEVATGRRVFFLEQPIGASDRQPRFDQGDALDRCIEWKLDSSEVRFVGKNGQAFDVPVR